MKRVFIALGSNIDKEKNLPRAIQLLADHCPIVAQSHVYETVAMGNGVAYPNFFNATVLIETELSHTQLKETVLAKIEQQLHRVRVADDKNAPRTIDADIILYGDQVLVTEDRQIPDPDLLKFVHVAVPSAEIAPQYTHPITGEPLATIAQRLLQEAETAHSEPILWQRPDIQLSM